MATQMEKNAFLQRIIPLATADMKKTKILASLTISQAILESAWGISGLTRKSNNLFGIKGNGVSSATFEYINGKKVEVTDSFKSYPSWEASVSDHSALFHRLSRYSNLIGETDYKNACRKVQADGYATAPNYAEVLINLIEQYQLYKYDDVPQSAPTFKDATIRGGMRGAMVHALQFRLNALGYPCGNADGIAGAKTIEAVKLFQRANGLTVDGLCGKNTWTELFEWRN